jgi:hypothetical protein
VRTGTEHNPRFAAFMVVNMAGLADDVRSRGKSGSHV